MEEAIQAGEAGFNKTKAAIIPLYLLPLSGNSSVGRALASQARGRGFEPRFPLHRIMAFGIPFKKSCIKI
jgi:hypothetical protein